MILKRKQKGFSGKTHWLIAILLVEIMWFIPIPYISDIIIDIKSKGVILSAIFIISALGAALAPDLDNVASTALFQLGPLGRILQVFYVSTASIVYTIFHTGKDKHKPGSYHRLFWHSPFSCFLLFLVPFFFMEDGEYTVFNLVKESIEAKELLMNPVEFISFLVMFILVIASAYLTYNMATYNIGRFIANKAMRIIKTVLTVATFIFLLMIATETEIRFLSYSYSVGSLFHIIGDCFSLGCAPILFPIPINGQFWWRPHIPGQLETGGTANKILDLILIIVDTVIFLLAKGIIK